MSAASIRIALLTEGTRGDAQPYLALALGLQKAGHVVKHFTNRNNVEFMKGFGIDVVGCGSDFEAWMRTDEAALDAMKTGNFFGFCTAMNSPNAIDQFRESVAGYWKGLEEFKPDLLLAAPLISHLALVYEFQKRVPYIRAELQLNVPTDDCAPYGLESSAPGTRKNLDVWHTAIDSWHASLCAKRDAIQDALGTDVGWRLDHKWYMDLFFDLTRSLSPALFGLSSLLIKKPSDFPAANANVTGWWTLDKVDQAAKCQGGDAMFGGSGAYQAMSTFIQAGKKPTCIGWGSMLAVSREHMALLAIRALKEAGQRGIVIGGWAELSLDCVAGEPDGQELQKYCDESVLFVKTAPHAWLFPQCACLVHHGGSGTTAAAVLSGVPMVITPVWVDQKDYAAQVEAAAIGVAARSLTEVTVEELKDAIQKCCTDQKMQHSAKCMAAEVSKENGVARSLQIISEFYRVSVKTGAWKAAYDEMAAHYQPPAHDEPEPPETSKPWRFCC